MSDGSIAESSSTANKRSEKEVYDYLSALLNSSDNPAKGDLDVAGLGAEEFDKAISEFTQNCKDYENKCVAKTSEYFNLTEEEVNQTFINQAVKRMDK